MKIKSNKRITKNFSIFIEEDDLIEFNSRRLYEDNKPDGYMESDRDYMENNRFLCVKFLDLLSNKIKRKE